MHINSTTSRSEHGEHVLLTNACSGGLPTCGQWYSSSSRSMRQPAEAPHFAAAAAAVAAAAASAEGPNCTAGGWPPMLMLRATGAWAGTLPCSQPPELLVRRTVMPQCGRGMQAPAYEPAAVLLLLLLPLLLPALLSLLQDRVVDPAAAAADITEPARASRPASVTLTQKERCRQRRKGRRPTSARPPSAQHNGAGQRSNASAAAGVLVGSDQSSLLHGHAGTARAACGQVDAGNTSRTGCPCVVSPQPQPT